MIENTAVLIPQGLLLMAAGMIGVFAFLIILLFITKFTGKVLPKLSYMLPDPEPVAPKKKKAAAAPSSSNEAVAVAVAVAMKRAGK